MILDNGKIVERLRRHYGENVLGHEPDQKCRELKERLKGPDGKKILAEGLSNYRSSYADSCMKIVESEVEGAEIVTLDKADFREAWGFEMPDSISMTVPEEKYGNLAEKWNLGEDTDGILLCGKKFKSGSVFDGIYVAIQGCESLTEHEILHLLHSSRSRALKWVMCPTTRNFLRTLWTELKLFRIAES